jgi:hypothetical protein
MEQCIYYVQQMYIVHLPQLISISFFKINSNTHYMSIFTHLAPNDQDVHLAAKSGPANKKSFFMPKGVSVCQKIPVLIIRRTKRLTDKGYSSLFNIYPSTSSRLSFLYAKGENLRGLV